MTISIVNAEIKIEQNNNGKVMRIVKISDSLMEMFAR